MTKEEEGNGSIIKDTTTAYNILVEAFGMNDISSSACLSAAMTYVVNCLKLMGVPEEELDNVANAMIKATESTGGLLFARFTRSAEERREK